MTKKKPLEWIRLDNAAKIFPPNSNEKDTKVFRFVCELKDEIDKDILQKSLDQTMIIFPFYHSVLRKGVFWYYFESSDLLPTVTEENKLPCSMLYHRNRKNLLFDVTYYKKRINFEVFHALSDGTGALWFLKTLIYFYIISRYQSDFKDNLPKLDYNASISKKMDDSFLKHYTGNKISNKVELRRAYHILGRRTIDHRLKIVEGVMSVKEVLALARSYQTTITVYLASLYIHSIFMEMAERGRKYPVVLSVPVNLRNYFPSDTARNFFGTIMVSYQFGQNKDSLEDIIKEVNDCFKRELTPEKLKVHMNQLAALELNAFTRVVPLSLKDVILRFATSLSDKGITAAISNVGKITMAEELSPYIHLFDVFTSTKRPQICMCSYEDQLVISFASPYIGADIQTNFFRALTEKGIHVTVDSNSSEGYSE